MITFEPFNPLDYIKTPEQLEEYVQAAIEEERESCAKVCESLIADEDSEFYWIPDSKYACTRSAELIRARSND